jgi:hypothetical protein
MHFGFLFSFNWPKSAKVWWQELASRSNLKVQTLTSPAHMFLIMFSPRSLKI